MTDEENAELENDLDEEIKERHIEYHFDNFLKNIFGAHDLEDVCEDCMTFALLAVEKHVQERLDWCQSKPDVGNN